MFLRQELLRLKLRLGYLFFGQHNYVRTQNGKQKLTHVHTRLSSTAFHSATLCFRELSLNYPLSRTCPCAAKLFSKQGNSAARDETMLDGEKYACHNENITRLR